MLQSGYVPPSVAPTPSIRGLNPLHSIYGANGRTMCPLLVIPLLGGVITTPIALHWILSCVIGRAICPHYWIDCPLGISTPLLLIRSLRECGVYNVPFPDMIVQHFPLQDWG